MTRITPPQETLPDSLAAVARTPGGTGGHDFATLLTEVAGESNFKPHVENKLTGAAGPYQFVQNTWLSLVKDYGESMGVKSGLVQQIHRDAQGRPSVAQQGALHDLLALRYDPVLATRMAGKYLDLAGSQLAHMLHREPSDAEVHLTYLLGPAGAAHLIHAAESRPETPVDQVVGAAFSANRSLFQHAGGEVRTAAEAVAFLADKYHADKARVLRMAAADADGPPET